LGDEGGHNLFMYLKKNNGLEYVDISGNDLGKKSIPAIAHLLKRNGKTLTHLDLSCNKLGNYTPTSTETQNDTSTAQTVFVPDLTGKTLLEAISLNKVLFMVLL
jgi:hypothetical protein